MTISLTAPYRTYLALAKAESERKHFLFLATREKLAQRSVSFLATDTRRKADLYCADFDLPQLDYLFFVQ